MKLEIKKSSSEHELIQACKKNNAKAQHMLYTKYAAMMLGLCNRYLNSRQDAEDVMMNGFMRIFNKISSFKGEGSFEGWMKRIMINEALGFIRKNKTMYLEVEIEKADKMPDLEVVGQALNTEDLLKMIKEMPAGYRTIFNLYALEGYSHKEIGDMLGISESTSKSQLSRARFYLQKKLSETEEIVQKSLSDHGDK